MTYRKSPDLEPIAIAPAGVRLEGMLESWIMGAPPHIRLCEKVDDALAHTPTGATCNVIVELNLKHDYVRVINSPATPMTLEEAMLLATIGRSEEERKLGSPSQEHGFGGTAALLGMADKNKGSLQFHTPYIQGGYLAFERHRWWKQLGEDLALLPTEPAYDIPTTKIILKGLNQQARNIDIRRFADYLGTAYKNALLSDRLAMRVLYQTEKSRTTQSIEVLPLEIPLIDEPTYSGRLSASPDGSGPYLHIYHGELDARLLAELDDQRDNMFGRLHRVPDSKVIAQEVRIYIGDRMLEPTTLRELQVLSWTNKRSLDPLYVEIHIEPDLRIKRSQYKLGLDPDSKTSLALYQIIRSYLAPIVARRLKSAPEPEDLTSKYREILEHTHHTLSEILQHEFTNAQEIAEFFGLQTTFLSESEQPAITSEDTLHQIPASRTRMRSNKETRKLLPGLGPTKTPRETIKEGDTSIHEYELGTPIPPMIVGKFDPFIPVTLERRDIGDAEDLQVIVYNIQNEIIRRALNAPNPAQSLSRAILVEKAIQALFINSGREYNQFEIDKLIQIILEKEK